MAVDGFEFEIEVVREGDVVGAVPARVGACVEDALFAAVVAGQIPNDGTTPPCSFTPVWDGGSPSAVAALELRLGDAPALRYDADVVLPQARAHTRALIAGGAIESSADVSWRLVARERRVEARGLLGRAVRVARAPLPLQPAELPGASTRGPLDVAIDAAVLDRLADAVATTAAVERAWLLVGAVAYDAKHGVARLRVVDAVDVEEGRGGASQLHFAFQPAAFVAARRAAAQLRDGAIPTGWAHSHPPCRDCPANPNCPTDTRFFSADDVEVHASAFPSPFMVGLVVGKVGSRPATQPGFRLYGWRRGQVVERSYCVSDEADALPGGIPT